MTAEERSRQQRNVRAQSAYNPVTHKFKLRLMNSAAVEFRRSYMPPGRASLPGAIRFTQ